MKLARIKREKEQSQMLEEKECTFKPKLTKNNHTKSHISNYRKSVNHQHHEKIEEVHEPTAPSTYVSKGMKNGTNEQTVRIARMKTEPL